MNLQFFNPYPYRTPEPDLHSLLHGSQRVDAAVAFVTRRGTRSSRNLPQTLPGSSHAHRRQPRSRRCSFLRR